MSFLEYSNGIWKFKNEAEFENFVWQNMEYLDLKPFKRQFYIAGQFCDILGLDKDNNLYIIELKNEEDRYVIQQITRYYHALKNSTLQNIHNRSYENIKLIIIAPSFHQDNWIDKLYHKLTIDLFTFKLAQDKDSRIYFSLFNTSNDKEITRIPINYNLESSSKILLPPVPRKFQKYIQDLKDEKQKSILDIREKILSFHKKIEEIPFSSGFLYQSSKTAVCAEFRYGNNSFSLFLRLPHPSRKKICRMRVWTRDWINIDRLTYSSYGFKSSEWSSIFNEPRTFLKYLDDFSNQYAIEKYYKLIQDETTVGLLINWVDIALENWLEKISK